MLNSGMALLAAVSLLAGCRRDGPLPDSARDKVSVRIATRAAAGGTMDGISLDRVRIIAVSGASGMVEFNEYADNAHPGGLAFEQGGHGADKAGNFLIDLLPGRYDLYAVVNETSSQSAALEAVRTGSDMRAVKLSAADISALTEARMVCAGEARGVVVAAAGEGAATARISADGGANWTDELNVNVVRAAAKLTIKARKQTANADDSFTVRSASLSGVPEYSYLLPRRYDGALRENVNIFSGSTAFTANTAEYRVVAEGYIVPEYLTADPADGSVATKLLLTADYTTGGYTDEVDYAMTLLGSGVATEGGAKSFDLERGRHYVVNVSISERGEFEYTPEIVYEVARWDKATENPANVTIGDNQYTVYRKWVDGTVLEDEGNTARVRINESVTMEFTLERPSSGRWTAQLSNPDDFYFDVSPLTGGVREGVAREGVVSRIVIRPRAAREGDVSTELYINIDNGVNEIEYNLNNDDGTGPGKRYVIKQIPR